MELVEVIKEQIESVREEYIAYTDGSCNNLSPYGEGGAAYVILKDGVVVHSASKGFVQTTNYRMELLAILSVLTWLPDGSSVTIYTDSTSCISACTKKDRPEKNPDIVHKCRARMRHMSVVNFQWVKGHSGNVYNEMVDQMAGAQTQAMMKKYNIPVYTIYNSPKCKRNQSQVM